MNVALLKYSNTDNIGDDIQTLAVAQHINQKYALVDRDFLHRYVWRALRRRHEWLVYA